MIKISAAKELASSFPPTAVTIGKFDGIHLGHQRLLEETILQSEEHLLVPTVLTFDRHPFELLQTSNTPPGLIGPNQKAQYLAEIGIELLFTHPFDSAFAKLSAEEFVTHLLVAGLSAKVVVVGEGFRFGSGARGDVELLKNLGLEHGFIVKVMPDVEIEGRKVSTTWVRELLLDGDVAKAAKLLGRYHSTVGIVEHGLKIGREIGFPTANMSRSAEGLLPRDAVYAGWLYADGERYMSALSVGINETFEAVPRLLEAHILDVRGLDLYGKVITCEYVEFIRPAAKFNGVEDLVAEINRDLDKIRQILG
ncbi:MAG: bifunctional riboflavin kinase/FAD synthetase [Acidobacteria bacterium]|nr:bifunctional riboflavin kinase/FAD synthetase [Acidobacteriota bacterium]